MKIESLLEAYEAFKVSNIEGRWFDLQMLTKFINHQSAYTFKEIGRSTFGKPIYTTTFGKGKKKLFIWSQMHGNESTGTRAMLDVLSILNKTEDKSIKTILENLEITFVPVLNPDGAEVYSRRHPIGIDPNRDFIASSLPEIQLLKQVIFEGKYDMLFNLHDQRTLFNPKGSSKPASLSFLSPSEEITRQVTDLRKQSMGVIGYMNKYLQKLIPEQIGRYTDEFYPTATGDNFAKAGFPSVLFEAGHFPDDYSRENTRKYNALAIILGMYFLATESDLTIDYKSYFDIPENDNKCYDILFRNVTTSSVTKVITDVGVSYEEKFNTKSKSVDFIAKIENIGDLSSFYGHKEYDAGKRVFSSLENEYPKLGQLANFNLGDWKIENGEIIS